MNDHKPTRQVPSGHRRPAATQKADENRPDIRTRFQPGRSGNSKGRPRGAKGRKQIVTEIALEIHGLHENGKRVRRTTLELVLLALRNQAIEGKVRPFKALHGLLQRYAPQRTASRHGYLIVPETLTQEEWEKFAFEQQREARGEPKPDANHSDS